MPDGTDDDRSRPAALPDLAHRYGDDRRLDVLALDPRQRTAVQEIVRGLPKLDGAAVNGYGADGQRATNRHLDELLARVTAADAGAGGALLAELATGIGMLDLPGLKAEAEGRPQGLADRLGSLPLIGRHFSAFARFMANRQRAVDLFAAIERRGEADLARLQAFDATLDRMVDDIMAGLDRMKVEIIAGQAILERERRDFHASRDAAVTSRDPLRLAALRDRAETIDAFEIRLLRLHTAFTRAVVEVPRTRMAQRAGRAEYRNVLDTLLFDLPDLKRRIIALAALRNTRLAADAAAARRDLNARLDATGMDELESAYLGSKEAEGGDLSAIAAMAETAARMVRMIDAGAAIDARNRIARDKAHLALADLRDTLADGLREATSGQVADTRYDH